MGNFDPSLFVSVDPEEFRQFTQNLQFRHGANTAQTGSLIDQIVSTLSTAQQGSFYPLVGRILTTIGFPTWVVRGGDTNNRIDAIIAHPSKSIPIEIKSPTETWFINVKSVQQALENKVILRSRLKSAFPTDLETTSLVVGNEYPAPRSDVHELIEDIRATFGVRIGLVSLRRLYEWLFETYTTGQPVSYSAIERLQGQV